MTGVPPQPGSEIDLRVPAGSFGSGFGAYIFFTIFGGVGPGSAGSLTSFLAAAVAEPDRRPGQPAEKAALGLAPPSSGGTLGAAKDIVSKAAGGGHSLWWWLAVAASALLALVCTLVLLTSGRRGPRPRIS